MKITLKQSGRHNQAGQAAQQPSRMRFGAWGAVTDVNSRIHAVTVRLASGVLLENVPVACTTEWVCEYKDEQYVTGMRNLPPEGSRVFILMPTGTFESAFVLCSGLSRYEKAHEKAFLAQENDRDEKNTMREKVLPGKWKSSYSCKTGQYTLTSPQEHITITVCDDNDKQEVSLTAFSAEIHIDKEGSISIKGKKSTVTFEGDVQAQIHGGLKAEIKKDADITAQGKVHINGKNPKAAREGDTVKVRIPAQSVVVAVAGQATGTMNPLPIECTGTITSGSESVTIGG